MIKDKSGYTDTLEAVADLKDILKDCSNKKEADKLRSQIGDLEIELEEYEGRHFPITVDVVEKHGTTYFLIKFGEEQVEIHLTTERASYLRKLLEGSLDEIEEIADHTTERD